MNNLQTRARRLYERRIRRAIRHAVEHGLGAWGDGLCGYLKDVFQDEISKFIKPMPKRKDPRQGHKVGPVMRLRIFKRDGYQCRNGCASKELTIDHRIPISKGGKTEDDNLQTLCLDCNLAKGAS